MEVPVDVTKLYMEDLANKIEEANAFCKEYNLQTKDDVRKLCRGARIITELFSKGIIEFK